MLATSLLISFASCPPPPRLPRTINPGFGWHCPLPTALLLSAVVSSMSFLAGFHSCALGLCAAWGSYRRCATTHYLACVGMTCCGAAPQIFWPWGWPSTALGIGHAVRTVDRDAEQHVPLTRIQLFSLSMHGNPTSRLSTCHSCGPGPHNYLI